MSRSAGFGTFMVRSKRARRDRNPHTGQPVTIATYGLTQDVENLQECMRQVLKRTAGPRSTLGRSAFGMFQASKLTEEHEDYCREPKDHRHGA
jgi:hypothetical protein